MKNGITLIVTIITIIVMLILVVVIVKTAYNGEIVDTAITATKKTQKEADREILQTAVVGATDLETRE